MASRKKSFKPGFTPLEISNDAVLISKKVSLLAKPYEMKDKPVSRHRLNRGLFLTGFTLIESIMVMVIIGILGVATIPRFAELNAAIKLRSAAKKVITDIRYAQSMAMAEHTDVAVAFDVFNNNYRAYFYSNNTPLIDTFTRQNLVLDFDTDYQFRGITLDSANFAGSGTVIFDYQGAPHDSGNNNLTALSTVTLADNYSTVTIGVTASTGRIVIQ